MSKTLQHSQPADSPEQVADAVVIGGGPAGSCAATLLADQGHDVVLLEREVVPRTHVGESLIPAANEVLRRLGVVDELNRTSFPRKHSVQFVGAAGIASAPFYFEEHDPLGRGHTWQVVRAEFDRMLLRRAERAGARVFTQTRALSVELSGNELPKVIYRNDADDQPVVREQRCRVVIDASGQSCFIAQRLGLRESDPELRNGTVWSWFRGAARDSGRDEGATIIFSSQDHQSWFWYIPLPDNIVSVGCTGSMDRMFGTRLSAEAVFQRELQGCPALEKRLRSATSTEPFRTTKDYSYRSRRAAGDRWILIGDAYGFIDPVYSSGVFLALKSAELAADVIHDALLDDDLTANRLESWQPEYDAGVQHFRRLVRAFYDPDFNFGEFLARYPEYRDDLTELLVGNVFAPNAGRLFETPGAPM